MDNIKSIGQSRRVDDFLRNQPNRVSTECGSKYAIVIHNLAIAKVAKEAHCRDKPIFRFYICYIWGLL